MGCATKMSGVTSTCLVPHPELLDWLRNVGHHKYYHYLEQKLPNSYKYAGGRTALERHGILLSKLMPFPFGSLAPCCVSPPFTLCGTLWCWISQPLTCDTERTFCLSSRFIGWVTLLPSKTPQGLSGLGSLDRILNSRSWHWLCAS